MSFRTLQANSSSQHQSCSALGALQLSAERWRIRGCFARLHKCLFSGNYRLAGKKRFTTGTRGLVAMTSAQHAESRQFDPGGVYVGSGVAICISDRETIRFWDETNQSWGETGRPGVRRIMWRKDPHP